ncbi:site-specific integrase [Fibrobacter intestinalis]|uniref:Site-specific recombinase XerD n=1 Tax=Fibrobacter intestinalis TaxID=28122 RepID=A0A1T4R0G8_9BACT|nr:MULTISPECIES: site-specific integrase [Fibrobacter]PBC75099.1 site-specific recombinase XerD [Fibrobacter sp. NR9]SKA09201.1 Site-specific recombinase XerD [Fibrobacter intestinalis]
MRFKEAAEKWFEKKCLGWSESSRAKYANILQKHLLPAFRDVNLYEIKVENVRIFAEEGLSGRAISVRNGNLPESGGNLRKINSVDNGDSVLEFESGLTKFGDSVEVKKIDSASVRNFAERALGHLAIPTRRFVLATLQQILKASLSPEDFGALDFPHAGTIRKGEAVPLSPEELAALIRALENSARSLLLIAFTGMRLGEACALKFSDFDFIRNTIKIHGTLERLPNEKGETANAAGTKGADENLAAEMENAKSPKTVRKLCPPKSESGHREIPIPENLLQWLKKMARENPPDSFLVKHDQRTLQNHFKKFLKAAGIAVDAHIHTLRHSFATHALTSDADLKALSVLLGHASTHTTLDLYVHPTFESKRRVQEAFWKFVKNPKRAQDPAPQRNCDCWGESFEKSGGSGRKPTQQ